MKAALVFLFSTWILITALLIGLNLHQEARLDRLAAEVAAIRALQDDDYRWMREQHGQLVHRQHKLERDARARWERTLALWHRPCDVASGGGDQ